MLSFAIILAVKAFHVICHSVVGSVVLASYEASGRREVRHIGVIIISFCKGIEGVPQLVDLGMVFSCFCQTS